MLTGATACGTQPAARSSPPASPSPVDEDGNDGDGRQPSEEAKAAEAGSEAEPEGPAEEEPAEAKPTGRKRQVGLTVIELLSSTVICFLSQNT